MEEIIKNREEIIRSIKKNFAENNGRRAMNIVRLHKDILMIFGFVMESLMLILYHTLSTYITWKTVLQISVYRISWKH